MYIIIYIHVYTYIIHQSIAIIICNIVITVHTNTEQYKQIGNVRITVIGLIDFIGRSIRLHQRRGVCTGLDGKLGQV